MEDVKKAHEKLVAKIRVHKSSLSAIVFKLEGLRREMEKRGKGWTAQTRATLEDEMRRSGYRPRI